MTRGVEWWVCRVVCERREPVPHFPATWLARTAENEWEELTETRKIVVRDAIERGAYLLVGDMVLEPLEWYDDQTTADTRAVATQTANPRERYSVVGMADW